MTIEPLAFPDDIRLTSVIYHTVDQTTVHPEGSSYSTSDKVLAETLLAVGFVDWNKDQSTGATAGSPGTWTPAGSVPPDSFTKMDTVTATPTTAWTTGQHMVLGDGSHAFWMGTNWQSGNAP